MLIILILKLMISKGRIMVKLMNKYIIFVIEKGIFILLLLKLRVKDLVIRVNWFFFDMEYGDSFLIFVIYGFKKVYVVLGVIKRCN